MSKIKKPMNQADLGEYDIAAIRRRVASKSSEEGRKSAIKRRDQSQMTKAAFNVKYPSQSKAA